MGCHQLSPFCFQKNEELEKIENPFDHPSMKVEVNTGLFKVNKLWISNHGLKKVLINLRSFPWNNCCFSLSSIDQLQLHLVVKLGPLSLNLAKFDMCQFHTGKIQIRSHNINRNLINISRKITVLAIRYLDFFIFLIFTLSKISKMVSSWRWVYTKDETAQRLPLHAWGKIIPTYIGTISTIAALLF